MPEKRLTKAQLIGAAIGFSIAIIIFQFGRFGLIPAFLIAYGSYWIVTKIIQKVFKIK